MTWYDVAEPRHRRERLGRIVAGAAGQDRDVHQHAGIAEQQRVAVGLGGGDRLGRDRAAGAAAVLRDHALAERDLQALRGDAGEQVGRAARRSAAR